MTYRKIIQALELIIEALKKRETAELALSVGEPRVSIRPSRARSRLNVNQFGGSLQKKLEDRALSVEIRDPVLKAVHNSPTPCWTIEKVEAGVFDIEVMVLTERDIKQVRPYLDKGRAYHELPRVGMVHGV